MPRFIQTVSPTLQKSSFKQAYLHHGRCVVRTPVRLGVCEVGCIPVVYATISVSSALSIVSACTPVLVVPFSPVSISAYAASVLMLSLPHVLLIVPTAATNLAIPIEISFFVSRLTVIDIADVFFSHLYL